MFLFLQWSKHSQHFLGNNWSFYVTTRDYVWHIYKVKWQIAVKSACDNLHMVLALFS